MITEAIYGVMTAILSFLIGLLPSWQRPTWLQGIVDDVASGIGGVSQLGHWIAFPAIVLGVAFILSCWLLALALRGGRITLSALTGGGGSAA